MPSKFTRVMDHFLATTKKGFDNTYWIFTIIAGAGIVTKLFGIGGAVASILAFSFFYVFGRMSIRRERRLAKEKGRARK